MDSDISGSGFILNSADESGSESEYFEDEDVEGTDIEEDEDERDDNNVSEMEEEDREGSEPDENFAILADHSATKVKNAEAVVKEVKLWDELMTARIKMQQVLKSANCMVLHSSSNKDKATRKVAMMNIKRIEKIQAPLNELIISLLNDLHDGSYSKDEGRLPCFDIFPTSTDEFTIWENVLEQWWCKTKTPSNISSKSNFSQLEESPVKYAKRISLDKSSLLHRTGIKRMDYRASVVLGSETNNTEPIIADFDPRIFDDGDFYQTQVRDVISRKLAGSNDPMSRARAMVSGDDLTTDILRSKKQVVDRRASKGRKIRYNIIPKLVSYMGPDNSKISWTDQQRDELFHSLFQPLLIIPDESLLFMGRKTTKLSSSSNSAASSKSTVNIVTTNLYESSDRQQKQSSPVVDDCRGNSPPSFSDQSKSRSPAAHEQSPLASHKRPRSVSSTHHPGRSSEQLGSPAKKQRASLGNCQSDHSNTNRKRPNSSSSNLEQKSHKRIDSPDSARSYWLRSKRESMKRLSNAGSDSGAGSSGRSNSKSHHHPTDSEGTTSSSKSSNSKNEKNKASVGNNSSNSSGGILSSLVSSSHSGTSNQGFRKSQTTGSKGQPQSSRLGLSKTSGGSGGSQLPSRRSHGAKMLSSSSGPGQAGTNVESPKDPNRGQKSGNASSSTLSGSNSLTSSFANAAAAMNSLSSSAGTSSSSGGIPTLPPGNGGDASSGAASLLRQFGRFLSRGGSSSGPTSARAISLLQQLQSATYDTEQLQCLQDLCDIINMNTEDTLQEFPARQASVVLTELMSGAAGFEVAITACRCLTYMLDCVPHASKFVSSETVRCLISKLNDIECIDIAEQALSALEFLSSSHHSKALLRAGGVSACLQFIDFFSTLCQQKSLTIVANCCTRLSPSDFSHVSDSIEKLAQQLLNQDRKCAELVAVTFSHLCSGCENDKKVLRQIAAKGFFVNSQQLLVTTPPVVGPGVYCQIIGSMAMICRHCPDQAVQLLLNNFPATLAFLLTGNREPFSASDEQLSVALFSGNTAGGVCSGPHELSEIVTLISELLPSPPEDELFSTFPQLKPVSSGTNQFMTFFQSPFDWNENPFSFLSSSNRNGDDEDDEEGMDESAQALLAMQSAVLGRNVASQSSETSSNKTPAKDNSEKPDESASALTDLYAEKPQIFYDLVANLTGPLLDICQTTTAGTSELKVKCLETLQRLLLVAPDNVLKAMIGTADLSGCLTQFLGIQHASDLRVAGLALQICHLLLRRQPQTFSQQAVKQGIVHRVKQTLAFVTAEIQQAQSEEKPDTPSNNEGSRDSCEANSEQKSSKRSHSRPGSGSSSANRSATQKSSGGDAEIQRSRRSSSRGSGTPLEQASSPLSGDDDSGMSFRKLRSTVKSVLGRGKSQPSPGAAQSSSMPTSSTRSGRKSDGSPHLQGSSARNRNYRPGRSIQSSHRFSASHQHQFQQNNSEIALNTFHKELRSWIAKWAQLFLDQLDENRQNLPSGSQSTSPVVALEAAAQKFSANPDDESTLVEMRDLILTQDFSLFELGSSGFANCLVTYLSTATASQLRAFLRLFAVLPPGLEIHRHDGVRPPESFQRQPIAELVSKLVGCLQQIETFEVKTATVKDKTSSSIFGSGGLLPSSLLAAAMSSSSPNPGSTAITLSPVVRFFSMYSLKLELRRATSKSATPTHRLSNSSTSSGNSLPSCLVRIDPLLTVDVLSRWIVQKGLHLNSGPLGSSSQQRSSGHRRSSNHHRSSTLMAESGADTSSVSGAEDIDDADSSIADFSSTLTDDGGMSSGPEASAPVAEGSSSQRSSGSSQVLVELLSNDTVLPPEYTLYQAVSQFGIGLSDEALFSLSPTDPLFQAPHTISFRVRSSSSSDGPTENESGAGDTSDSPSQDSPQRSVIPNPSLGILDDFLRQISDENVEMDASVSVLLRLLRMLYGLNRYWYSLFDVTAMNDGEGHFWFPSAPVRPLMAIEDFVSPKMNLKASRQLRDVFVLATGIVPKWLLNLCSYWPFLLSYEVRQQIFYLTTFGRDRGILRMNNQHSSNTNSNSSQQQTTTQQGASSASTGSGPSSLSSSDQAVQTWLSRIVRSVEKRRYEVNRSNLLADAMRVLKQSSTPSTRSSIVEIQYKNEVGVGLGPTLEFYALVSRHLQQPELDLWHAHGFCDGKPQPGAMLYPKSHSGEQTERMVTPLAEQHGGQVELFRFLGQFVARALVDGRMVDLSFNPLFIDRLLMPVHQHEQFRALPTDLLWVDKALARSVVQLVEISKREDSDEAVNKKLDELMLDFEVPGRPDVDLAGNDPTHRGPLTSANLEAYISALLEFFLSSGIADFIDAFSDGFNSVFPISALRRFFCSASEIEAVLGGSNDTLTWDPQLLRDAIRPDHGFNQDSPVIQWLVELLVSLDFHQRRLFLQFATGTPRLPLGGFAALSPPLTVVRRALEQSANPDDFLPSVMTCANYLKVPEYSTKDILRQKLLIAITDGQETFHLS